MFSGLKRILIGRPMRSEQLHEERLPSWKALPILSSDNLSSLAYGPQELLHVLAPLGMIAMGYAFPVTAAIVLLLSFLILSYRQVVHQYPGGGGAYVVASDNLGWVAGLVAGSSLLVDYVLTCAVSVTAGVDAIYSAVSSSPDIAPYVLAYKVWIVVFLILVIMFCNLRGLRESGTVFAVPTYFFLLMVTLLVICGLWKVLWGDGGHGVVHHDVVLMPDVWPLGLTPFVLLHAFSSGCSSLTGVEAVANATSTLRPPEGRRAAGILSTLGWTMGILLMGVTFLTLAYGLVPDQSTDTILSRVGEVTFGRGFIFYTIQAATALILILAANTSFSALPVLSSTMARDRFMPRMFTLRGDRLNFSNGIIVLAMASILLVIAFGGDVSRLIPLYAIGVFLSFTLSQAGMVKKWFSQRPSGWWYRMIINAIGGVLSFVVLIIFSVTKFSEGAWLILIILPLLLVFFYRIRCHYDNVARQLRPEEDAGEKNVAPAVPPQEHFILVPVSGINRVVHHTLAYARSLGGRVIAIHITFDHQQGKRLEGEWKRQGFGIRLMVIYSRFRSLIHPLLRLIDHFSRGGGKKGKRQITILIAEIVPVHWWHRILHNQSALLIRFFLLRRKDVVITTIPYRLRK
ncbi:APC family permease [Pasteuria penetrans]|uniref:APC family permease n=1 Tax=Pasteuria penetrans TaxID=86005 RepID=UPI000FB1FD21|nr:APC family permease [Pasteuria penetrans]